MDILEHNRRAWNNEVAKGNRWTVPVDISAIRTARDGKFDLFLTPIKPVPMDWFGDLRDSRVLCLASGGGQQGPLLAAAGACVTVFDNSDAQLQRDRDAAVKFGLNIETVQGNMQDLGCSEDGSFDLIVHPVSNTFIDDIQPVWREASRVLRRGGRMLSGFDNPIMHMIDWDRAEQDGTCILKHAVPYSDANSLSADEKATYKRDNTPLEFGHTLAQQIAGQIAAGLAITGFYEDRGADELDPYTDSFIATMATKT
jgi:SAM-dependent methyltransferase